MFPSMRRIEPAFGTLRAARQTLARGISESLMIVKLKKRIHATKT
jgi:hypothetical protein